MRTEWIFFFPEFGAGFVFHQTVGSPPIRGIHNDPLYVRFGGINTNTWSKSINDQMSSLIIRSHIVLLM